MKPEQQKSGDSDAANAPEDPGKLVVRGRRGRSYMLAPGDFIRVHVSKPEKPILALTRRRNATRHGPALKDLRHFADLFPLATRKRIKAMAGDYDVEVRRLRKQGRRGMARWNIVLAWTCALWFALKSPFTATLKWALGVWKSGT